MLVALFLMFASSVWACPDNQRAVELISADANAPPVFVDMDKVPVSAPFSVFIQVCAESGPIKLDFDADMPTHQHGMNYTPQITDLGDGEFQASGVVFHMPGAWRLRVKVTAGSARFDYSTEISVQ
ncbi:MAG: hypothetical protein AB3N23_01945 [Paracoccaceae bacterium]